jgi:hypothetical protein
MKEQRPILAVAYTAAAAAPLSARRNETVSFFLQCVKELLLLLPLLIPKDCNESHDYESREIKFSEIV